MGQFANCRWGVKPLPHQMFPVQEIRPDPERFKILIIVILIRILADAAAPTVPFFCPPTPKIARGFP